MGRERSQATANSVMWVLWFTYGAFYFCRVNLGAAAPLLGTELGLTKVQIGSILAGLKLAYGIGQFVNGQLAERISPRKMLALGMFGSAALNVAFGLGTSMYFLMFVWACNGYSQSLGWTPTMRVAANWFAPHTRGRVIGTIGTGYQLMGAVGVFVAGLLAERMGWRAAMYVPACILAAAGLFMLLFLREAPPDFLAATDREAGAEKTKAAPARESVWTNVLLTLTNPALWVVALTLCLLDACRYGFTDWGITHLKEVQSSRIDVAALKLAVLPMGGIAGAYISGWVSDRFFGSRRAPVICILMLCLGGLTLIYDAVARVSLTGTVVLLGLIGFTIFGPQVLLVGTTPVDLARRGTAAAAVGFVNFMGYMGAFFGDMVTGHLAQEKGWEFAVRVWAGWAFLGAVLIGFLWRAKPHSGEVPVVDRKEAVT